MNIDNLIHKQLHHTDEDRIIQFNIDMFNVAVTLLNEAKRHNLTVEEVVHYALNQIKNLKSNEQ